MPESLRKYNYDITVDGSCGPASVAASLLKRYESDPNSIPNEILLWNSQSQREENLRDVLRAILTSQQSPENAVAALQLKLREHVAQKLKNLPDGELRNKYQLLLSEIHPNLLLDIGIHDRDSMIGDDAAATPEIQKQIRDKYIEILLQEKSYVDATFFQLLSETLVPIQIYTVPADYGQPQMGTLQKRDLFSDDLPIMVPIRIFHVGYHRYQANLVRNSNGQGYIEGQHFTLLEGDGFDQDFAGLSRVP